MMGREGKVEMQSKGKDGGVENVKKRKNKVVE